jgi:hypothetical protein
VHLVIDLPVGDFQRRHASLHVLRTRLGQSSSLGGSIKKFHNEAERQ